MQILIIRHGIAVDPDKFAAKGGAEQDRPLTERGAKRTKRAARGLRRVLEHIDLIATSPFRRALQTAEIVARVFASRQEPQFTILSSLSPGSDPAALCEWLRDRESDSIVAIVGHEPDMSRLVAYLVSGNEIDFVRFGKAGAALLRCREQPVAGSCELVWVMPPSILRRLGV